MLLPHSNHLTHGGGELHNVIRRHACGTTYIVIQYQLCQANGMSQAEKDHPESPQWIITLPVSFGLGSCVFLSQTSKTYTTVENFSKTRNINRCKSLWLLLISNSDLRIEIQLLFSHCMFPLALARRYGPQPCDS